MRNALAILVALAFYLAGCSEPSDPAEVVGSWSVETASIDNAAYNLVRVTSDHAGRNLTDAEIEPVAKEIADQIRANPATYTIDADGTFTAAMGPVSFDGTWTYEKNILSLESSTSDKLRRFTVDAGTLVSIADTPRHRPIRMTRK